MPELPEVETIVRELLANQLIGKRISSISVHWERIVETPKVAQFIKDLQNETILDVKRRGKYIVFILSRSTLLVHLRMTGRFQFINKNMPINKNEHVRLTFSDGTGLRYEDPRKFGRWSLWTDATEKMNELGIEPLSTDFTVRTFKDILQTHSSQIKPFLLNQKYIAGLGNIYVDEALWEAKIHPQRLTNSLSHSETSLLHKAIINVLNRGIENLGTSLGTGKGNYVSVTGKRGGNQYQLKVFRQQGQKCSRCGHAIIKTVVAQRGTHLCPNCQKRTHE